MRLERVLSMCACALVAACAPTPSPSPSASPPLARASDAASRGAIAFIPSYAVVPCPDEITLVVINDVECGYLTVLEDRAKPSGRTIRLFVAKVVPPGGTDRPDEGGPGPGGDIAAPREFGGAAPGAQRTHRNLYLMDERGVGLSEPNLDCPEVHAAAPVLVGLRVRDPAHRATLLTAVGACHDRLAAAGVDLAAYDIAAIAQDHEDLRVALGTPVMNVGANQDGSIESGWRMPAVSLTSSGR